LEQISEINVPKMNPNIWMPLLQVITQLSQPVLTSRNQNHRACTSGELPRKFATYASGSPRDKGVTTIKFHVRLSPRPLTSALLRWSAF